MSDTPHLVPYPLVMQLPADFIPQKVLMIAMDQSGRVRFDGENNPFAHPAIVAMMAARLCEAISYSLTCGPTVAMPPEAPITHSQGNA